MKKSNGGIGPIPKIMIECITPLIDDGLYPIKRVVGEWVTVEADIFKDGHDVIVSYLKFRSKGKRIWSKTEMIPIDNDRWRGSFLIHSLENYEYTIEATVDVFTSWKNDFVKKLSSEFDELESEIQSGVRILNEIKNRSKKNEQQILSEWIQRIEQSNLLDAAQILLESNHLEILKKYLSMDYLTIYPKIFQIITIRKKARYGAWYEIFPRSQGVVEGQSGTFDDCIRRLPEIAQMGFDVLYFPPIHPIGISKRKGKNNNVKSMPGEPGSPYAIGNHLGGHKAIEPQLGTMDDFERLVDQSKEHGMEIAFDLALNCSPDHPYVKDHPDWFYKRPDGTIKYAENPPKKYEDIYPLNFYCTDWKNLWKEIQSIILFWAERGVKIFRVDNPHTKPVYFWEWLIRECKAIDPQLIFLSEAFTKPKMMKILAKVGFDQSYTYFTWRTQKQELIEYFEELTQSEMKEYFIGNLFTNTPDILPFHLQSGGRAMFQIRSAMAMTLSSVYGIYSGFELCENQAIEGKEEYFNSEKYEYKVWDWNRPGNIKDYIRQLNKIRKEHLALHHYDNLRFVFTANDQILAYYKITDDLRDIVLMVVNLDPHHKQQSMVDLPIDEFCFHRDKPYQVKDLITDIVYTWKGNSNFVELDPSVQPVHVFHVTQ